MKGKLTEIGFTERQHLEATANITVRKKPTFINYSCHHKTRPTLTCLTKGCFLYCIIVSNHIQLTSLSITAIFYFLIALKQQPRSYCGGANEGFLLSHLTITSNSDHSLENDKGSLPE